MADSAMNFILVAVLAAKSGPESYETPSVVKGISPAAEAGRAATGTNGQRAEVPGSHQRVSRSDEVFVELEAGNSKPHHEAAAVQSRFIDWALL
jgi:hypothetical protein